MLVKEKVRKLEERKTSRKDGDEIYPFRMSPRIVRRLDALSLAHGISWADMLRRLVSDAADKAGLE